MNVKKSAEKIRLDKLLLERGVVPSRERAQALILAGKILVNGQKVEKSGASVNDDAEIRLLGEDLKYVSRGGLKLEHALAHWKINVTGKICLDVGASTGGFTDCLLQHGAARVIAVDTGHGQIALPISQRPSRPPPGKDQRPLSHRRTTRRDCRPDRNGRFLHLGDSGPPRRSRCCIPTRSRRTIRTRTNRPGKTPIRSRPRQSR